MKGVISDLIRFFLSVLSIVIAAYILPGVHLNSFLTAIAVAIILGFLNIFLKPLLILFTIPITIFTFGLFLLVINAVIVVIAHSIIPGFVVDSFGWAVLFSVLVTLVSYVLSVFHVQQ
jgi:putative membrane protein